jgi:hypothetical protein
MVEKYLSNHPISMVIPGLMRGRLGEKLDTNQIISTFKMFKSINPNNEIVVSTYRNEIPEPVLKYTDKVVINDDPGPDSFIPDRWMFMRQKTHPSLNNFSRFFLTNYNGIRACKNQLVLKSRIEMMPSDPSLLISLIKEYQISQVSKITALGFFTEHYSGIFHSTDGVLGGIPGTVQFGPKETLEKLYFQAMKFWQVEQKRLTRRANRHPITTEQILGLNFLYLFCNFPLNSILDELNKYYASPKLIQFILKAEVNNFVFLSLKKSGFVLHKYQGTIFIKTPVNLDKQIHKKIVIKIIIVFLKRYKHMFRRFRSSFFG